MHISAALPSLIRELRTQRNAPVLDALRRITHELNSATSLDGALDIVVHRVKECLAVDVCSVYLVDASGANCTLMATDGLDPKAIGRIQFGHREGLVGMVVESGQPLSTTNAAHPRFRLFPNTERRAAKMVHSTSVLRSPAKPNDQHQAKETFR